MQGIGADGAVRAEHVLGALKLETVIGDTDDRGLHEGLIFKRDQLRRSGLQRPDVQHILISVHIAVEVDLRIAVRIQIGQPDMGVKAGRIGGVGLFKAGVEDVRTLLDAKHERLLIVLIPDAQQLNRLRRTAAVQIGLAAADDLRADALEAVERDAVVGNLCRDGILRGKFNRGKRFRFGFFRDGRDRLRVSRRNNVLSRLFGRDDADGNSQHLRRVRLGNVAKVGNVHLKRLRQFRHGDGPAVRAGGNKPVGQRDRDCFRSAERRIFIRGADG